MEMNWNEVKYHTKSSRSAVVEKLKSVIEEHNGNFKTLGEFDSYLSQNSFYCFRNRYQKKGDSSFIYMATIFNVFKEGYLSLCCEIEYKRGSKVLLLNSEYLIESLSKILKGNNI